MSTQQIALREAFERFANFGSSKSNLAGPTTMDNAQFAKLCRDAKVLSKNVSTVDVDIFFKKVLVKGERRINFEQFHRAIQYLAEKKYPGDNGSVSKLAESIIHAQPIAKATQAQVGGIYSKLTDTSLYTGTHKERFDETGKGRGLDGRDTISKTSQLSQIVSRTNVSSNAKRPITKSIEELSAQNAPRPMSAKKSNLAASTTSLHQKPASQTAKGSEYKLSKSSSSGVLKKSNSSVYDRLTDSNQYTGTHKHRFDSSGKGLGLAGRDSVALGQGTVPTYRGGNVHSLSQILRN